MSERTVNKPIAAIVSFSLIAGAIVVAIVLVATKPKAEKVPPPKRIELVNVQPLERSDETVVLRLTGIVTPAKKVMLRSRVSGEVVGMASGFIDGGLLAGGEAMLTIDPVDYELALAQSESALEKARFDYKIELGRQDVAKREWELLKPEGEVSELETELALRIPHLSASKAALQAAEANLAKSRLDLERTRIKAPFNAVVLSRNTNLGSQAAPQDILAELAGTDAYWVTVSVPVDRIHRITIPGSTARIHSGNDHVREGTVIKLLGDLEEKGRMARVLIEVKDPLAQQPENSGKKPLLLGEYVRADIDGQVLSQVFSIPRNALRENSQVWLATSTNTLAARTVEVLWRDAGRVLVADGLSAGEELIVSDITAPIPGMDISTGKMKDEISRTDAKMMDTEENR
jgi:RND family efflux transporter MFP subunit